MKPILFVLLCVLCGQLAALTPAETQQLSDAKAAVLKTPEMKAATAKFNAARKAYQLDRAKFPAERSKEVAVEFRKATKEYDEAIRKAMLARDPALAPLLDQQAKPPARKPNEGETVADSDSTKNPAIRAIKDVPGLPRVLLIGDSISIGYTLQVRELLKGEANVHRIPVNGGATEVGLANMKTWLADGKWDVIHFNFGLHDAKFASETAQRATREQYAANLHTLVAQMKATGAKLIFATTTPVPRDGVISPTRRFDNIPARNEIAVAVMKENGVAIDDLYALVLPVQAKVGRDNDVHFQPTGYELLAKGVAASIEAQLPKASAGSKLFVDPTRGDDRNAGDERAPWKTLAHALRGLNPGDTLLLRGGVFYEKVVLTRSGTAEAPITIASFPGEQAVIDGGLREFAESPATSWEPLADGEFVSTKTYPHADARRAPRQFLPASWEPMWGIEDERPVALGHFADSMIPLHGYRHVADLRATNELWPGGKDVGPIYCGPGLWFDRETQRIHIRLAHHALAGLGTRAYRGETDPRKLPLIVAAGFGDDVLRITGIKHVRINGLTFRGATGSPMIHIYGSEDIALDHVTIFGGFPALLLNASKNMRVTHSAFRGLAAPWSSRAHMKYRGTASYQVVLQDNQPLNENIEFAWCEFTDDHDCAFLRFAKNLQFHHNFVDNFNDDGLECGPKMRAHTIFIYQNRIGACLSPFTQHEIDKDESPLDHDPKTGVFVFRNVIDLRAGTYKAPPKEPDPSGAFLHEEGHLIGDHGGPIWAVMHYYQNTALRHTPVFRDYFLFGLGTQALRYTDRDVFNSIFVQTDRVPGAGFAGMKEAGNLREGGNLLWGMKQEPALTSDFFAKFRASPLFSESRKFYEPGWTTHDRVADPKFVNFPSDLRLQAGSPAIKTGQPLPAERPDPLRTPGAPDIGALPFGAEPWGVGVDGRIPLAK